MICTYRPFNKPILFKGLWKDMPDGRWFKCLEFGFANWLYKKELNILHELRPSGNAIQSPYACATHLRNNRVEEVRYAKT